MSESAVRLDVPGLRWSAGAPEPVVVSSETRTFVAFYLDERDVVDAREVQTAEFVRCVAFTFGFPNDEVLQGHRLWGHGLEFYGLHEVVASAWIDDLRTIERRHRHAPAEPFPAAKHFVLTFHDTVLEAVASEVRALDAYVSVGDALRSLTEIVSG